MEEYGIMEYLEVTVTRCERWTGNREFIWSGLMFFQTVRRNLLSVLFIPYTAKLSRGKTFVVFAIMLPTANVFPSNILCEKT